MLIRFIWVCFVLTLLWPVVGCAPKGSEIDPTDRTPQVSRDDEPQWPQWYPHAVDVRVHPASRYVMEREDMRLEARIELIDQFNESVKDVGRLIVELRLLDPNGQMILDDQGRQRGLRWEFDLTTQEMQQTLWDPIARAYLLPLRIDAEDADFPRFRTVLRVTFDPAWPDLPTLPMGERARQPVEIRTDW